MSARINLEGRRFGRLVVTAFAGVRDGGWAIWHARCDCGNQVIARSQCLRNGSTRSCGCLASEITIKRNRATAKWAGEAMRMTPEYRAWSSMKRRCYDPGVEKYKLYGGRGIVVCDRWRESYSAFLTDMGRRPSPRHSLDRFPNRDGNYEPSNCRWATASEQNSNRRTYTRRQRRRRKANG